MGKHDISIIIPYYNTANELEKLLFSIGKHQNVEVLIIDDLSNKNFEKYNIIKKDFVKLGFKFYTNKTGKKGAGVARNIGLENASGKWLLFADADDCFLDDWYKIVCRYLNSDFDIVFFSPICKKIGCSDNGKRADKYKGIIDTYLTDNCHDEKLLRFDFNVPWSKLFKRELINKNNIFFDETLYSNDVMFSTKTGFYAQKISVSRDEIYCVQEGLKTSLTSCKNLEVFEIRYNVELNKCRFLYDKFGRYFYLDKPLGVLNSIILNRLGFKTYFKFFKLFREVGVPFIYLTPFNKYKVKYYLKKIIRYLKEKILLLGFQK